MTKEVFEALVEQRIGKIRSLLASKAKEYATSQDVLRHFKQAGKLLGCTQEEALLGFMVKHLVSIIDMVHAPDEAYTFAQWDEKIGDAINYLILLEALVQD